MFTLIKGGNIYSPGDLGKQDLLICMGKIGLVSPELESNLLEKVPDQLQVIKAHHMMIIPGLIDQHMHFLGGGGKLGYRSRAGIVPYQEIVRYGVTTAIGSLGVDSFLKSLKELFTRAKELESQGLSTYILTGGFSLPLQSITSSIFNDLIFIDKVVGVGEIGISDSYDSQPTVDEIIRISTNTKVVSAMSEKAGIIFIHIGSKPKGLNIIQRIMKETDLSIEQFVVTHVNRSPRLLKEAIEFAKLGGRIDITTGISPELGIKGSIPPHEALKCMMENSVPIEQVTLSSDSGGYRAVDCNDLGTENVLLSSETLLHTIKEYAKNYQGDFSKVLPAITSNVAKIWNLNHKGEIKPSMDADLVFLDQDLEIKMVMIKGKIAFRA